MTFVWQAEYSNKKVSLYWLYLELHQIASGWHRSHRELIPALVAHAGSWANQPAPSCLISPLSHSIYGSEVWPRIPAVVLARVEWKCKRELDGGNTTLEVLSSPLSHKVCDFKIPRLPALVTRCRRLQTFNREIVTNPRPCGPMDKALAYGARDFGFDPQHGRRRHITTLSRWCHRWHSSFMESTPFTWSR
jgi:hypothetical protein